MNKNDKTWIYIIFLNLYEEVKYGISFFLWRCPVYFQGLYLGVVK